MKNPSNSPWKWKWRTRVFSDSPNSKTYGRTLKAKVYRKPMHTGHLPFDSNHTTNVDIGATRCLYDTAKNICAEEGDIDDKIQYITSTLKFNGHTDHELSKVRRTKATKRTSQHMHNNNFVYQKPIG